ncbi:ExeM/NucH family extracellular endonuclease [Microbacterium sp. SORGH_AS_0888]|uniref:ExeM/NucH family extracellular endonuclease n=1 Tax=Microbacterium sp. SORGH_AS_0888 TaxID=3041791 RepID=UPI00278675AF|nr:ExeM/NucH family extracellular endonuclease [Microbacterium sp. SORGH_AS_0888]MDQ1130776.1 5'-nucleotidase [Microbacterium sp. SORGH_AS_0888]
MLFSQRGRRLSLTSALGVGAVLGAAVLVPIPASAATGARVVINEVYGGGGNNGATYTNDFIELYNAGDTALSLEGYSVQYRSGTGTGAATGVTALTGSIEPGATYLVAEAAGSGGTTPLPTPDATGTIAMSGTAGTVWLADTTEAINPGTGSVVGAAQVVDLIGYGANTFEGSAAAKLSNTTAATRTDGADTNVNSADFTVAAPTPQSSGSGGSTPQPEPSESGEPQPEPSESGSAPTTPDGVTPIAAIQGTGETSPLAGTTVTTRGVVTAAYPRGGFNGFYIQTPGTGGAIDTAAHTASDAVFVFGSSAVAKVAVGDYVEVTGPVSEYRGTTEISPAASGVTVLSDSVAPVTPAAVSWPATDAERERLEGMLLAPQGAFTVSDTYDTNYYASIGLAAGDRPLLTPTEVAAPGTDAYTAAVADNAARAVTLDDGSSLNFTSAANTSIPLPYLSTTAPVRVGAAVTFTRPVVLEYRNSQWNLQPTQQLTVDNAASVQPATFANTRTSSPADVGGDIQIAGFNVLNYFPTTGEDAVAAGASCTFYNDREGNPITVNTCSNGPSVRGAADDANLARQQAKIVAAINGLGAEVVSLEEIENSTIAGKDRDAAVATLVAALNAALGAEEWAYVPSPAAVPAKEDVIRTAFIYKKAAVKPVGESVIDDAEAFQNARQPLAQAFARVGASDDQAFIAIVNHFKSKRASGSRDGDAGDGQGAGNGARVAQAKELLSFSSTLQQKFGTTKVFLIGDFNAYTKEDPIRVLTDAGYVDQGSKTGKYSYSFDGASGSLDHILASPDAEKAVTGADIWNINAGESIALEYSRYNYNATNFYDASPYRSSDHDPIVVGVDLPEVAPVELNLLNINDFHGRIDTNTVKFAGTIEQLRAQHPDSTLFLSDGDNIGASLFASSSADDKPTLDVLNALGLDASAVGNHEFDKGFSDLSGRVADEADFPYLGANVYVKGTTTPALDEYTTFEVQGLTVAVIGAVTQETPSLVAPGGISGLDFGDPVEAVNRVAARLTDGDPSNGEAQVIIAEYHEGAAAGDAESASLADELAAGKAFAQIVQNTSASVDAIFTGHTHKKYAWNAPVPGVPGATRPVLQTGSYGENIGQVVLTLDPTTGRVLSSTVRNVARTTTDDATLTATYPRVAEVKGIVDAAIAAATLIGNQPVGSVTADITTAYVGSVRDNRAKQSTLGNLVADSLVSSLSAADRGGAEIGIVNPGGLRAELRKGDDGVITYAEANAVLPFVNNLWTTTLTGAQFKSVLEEQWQLDDKGNVPSRPYLQLGLSDNVSYTYDAQAPQGSHITSVWIDGVPLDPAKSYRVGSFSFLLQGGDNFRTLAQGTDTRDSGLIDRDAWIQYLQTNSPLSPSFASRSAQVTGLPAAVAEGGLVSFQVSGLDLTSLGSPVNTTLEARIGDAAYAPIAVHDGIANVALTLPSGVTGAVEIVLTAPDSGTVVRLPLTVLAATGGGDGGGASGGQPTQPSTPAPESALTSTLQNIINAGGGQLSVGATITIHIGVAYAGQWVAVWLHSDPVFLGWKQVDAAGNVTVTLPANVSGDHRLVVQDAAGNVIGWQAVGIRELAATGGDGGPLGGIVFAAVLLLGLGLSARIVTRRRRA